MVEPYFDIPVLFYALCVQCGAALILSPFVWLWLTREGRAAPLGSAVILTLLKAVLLLVVMSAALGVLRGDFIAVLPELIIGGALAVIYIFRHGRRRFFGFTYHLLVLQILIGAFAFMSVALAYAFVWGFSQLQLSGGVHAGVSASVCSLMLLLYLLYGAVYSESSEERQSKVKFYDLLWPFALGLFLLIVPLLMVEIAVNPDLYRQLHPPPRLQGV